MHSDVLSGFEIDTYIRTYVNTHSIAYEKRSLSFCFVVFHLSSNERGVQNSCCCSRCR